MKIAGGELRSRTVLVPKGTRPTSGRAREALFSRWQTTIPDGRFLDLFAGGGGIGLEAISRGAREVVFVESNPRAVEILRRNCNQLAAGACQVVQGSALSPLPRWVGHCTRGFDHVFADPPYDFDRYPELLARVAGYLDAVGEAAVEHSSRVALPADVGLLVRSGSRRYGESILSFFRLAG